jgi:hypothetical protein
MSHTAKVTYGDDSSVLYVYKLQHIANHLQELKKKDVTVRRSIPITPWLIAMAFDDAVIYKNDSPIKSIEIQEGV